MKIFHSLSLFKRIRPQNINKNKKKCFSTYFLHGTDSRQLPFHMQNQLNSLIRYTDPNSSSFLVYNSHEAQRKIKNWSTTLPWIEPHYAIKSNPIMPLLEDLHDGGAGFDCASKKEIQLALDVGADKEHIVYSNSVKEVSSLKYAHKNKIYLTTADTIDELEKIQEVAPKMKILWRLSIKEDNSEQLKTVFSNKFGDDLNSTEEAEDRFRQIRNMGIKLEGIHFHCGSGQNGSSSFKKAIKTAQKCMEIGRKHGHNMETLDLGGGFPAGELNDNIVDALELTQSGNSFGYRVIAEPGRHFSSNTCYLATKVIGKRIKDGKICYHINDSLYHSFNCILMDGVSFEMSNDQFYSAVDSKGKRVSLDDESFKIGSIFGMTCDGHDVIAKSIALPQNINVGDWLIIGGMGAYTVGPKSNFNGMDSTKKIIRWIAPLDNTDEQQSGIFMDTLKISKK